MNDNRAPNAQERMQFRRKGVEHIGVNGLLHVPVASSMDTAPVREGWEPFWVNVNLDRRPQKWVIYRRPKP